MPKGGRNKMRNKKTNEIKLCCEYDLQQVVSSLVWRGSNF